MKKLLLLLPIVLLVLSGCENNLEAKCKQIEICKQAGMDYTSYANFNGDYVVCNPTTE